MIPTVLGITDHTELHRESLIECNEDSNTGLEMDPVYTTTVFDFSELKLQIMCTRRRIRITSHALTCTQFSQHTADYHSIDFEDWEQLMC